MWFIFPQLQGLGSSSTSQFYAIHDRAEATAYLDHAILSQWLLECADALLAREGQSASDIVGYPDDLKLKSSATLFAAVSPPGSVFEQVLRKYFGGQRDTRTLELLAAMDCRSGTLGTTRAKRGSTARLWRSSGKPCA